MSSEKELLGHPKDKNPYQPRINAIRKVIYSEDKRLRQKYTWLRHQNAIGMLFFLSSTLAIITTSYLYITGSLAWYWMIPLIAFYVSIHHELEHDLIHELYFADRKWIMNIMFMVIWISKCSANPWWRKSIHLKHHKTSGQRDDVEERLIGLGQGLTIKHALATLTPVGAYFMAPEISVDVTKMGTLPGFPLIRSTLLSLPLVLPSVASFIGFWFPGYIPEPYYSIVFYACMVSFFPNALRQVSLQIISTGCHYFGDIPENNVYFQNQVLNHWLLLPLQVFCFNFGATHILHHYVTRQPFYLRQMSATAVAQELKKQGVRFNDLTIYSRAHRYYGYNGESAPVAGA
jgi:hypothetical protein